MKYRHRCSCADDLPSTGVSASTHGGPEKLQKIGEARVSPNARCRNWTGSHPKKINNVGDLCPLFQIWRNIIKPTIAFTFFGVLLASSSAIAFDPNSICDDHETMVSNLSVHQEIHHLTFVDENGWTYEAFYNLGDRATKHRR